MPDRDSTATSVVPPPMSTTMEPVGSWIGRPVADGGGQLGSSIRPTRRAEAFRQLSLISARRSTAVAPTARTRITLGFTKLSCGYEPCG